MLLVGFVASGPAEAASHRSPTRGKPTLGPNLVVNPGFEQPAVGSLLPAGWLIRGAAVEFQYNTGNAATGQRSVAISGTLGPGATVCYVQTSSCTPSPAHPVTGPIQRAAKLRPFWVTEVPIPVRAGRKYRLSFATHLPDAGYGEDGAESYIVWLGANGAILRVSPGARYPLAQWFCNIAPERFPYSYCWYGAQAEVSSPPGAAGAKLLLGYTDYLAPGASVGFDDVALRQVLP